MVVFDTSFLSIAFDKNAGIPIDPTTKKPVTRCAERINLLIDELSDNKDTVLIPTPVLAEFLVRGGKSKSERLQLIKKSKAFAIRPFDEKAAIECALMEETDGNAGKALDENQTRAKVKFDRQIVAVAKSLGAHTIYTGDENLAARARKSKIAAVLTWELPAPPLAQQMTIDEVPDEDVTNKDKKPIEPSTAIEPPAGVTANNGSGTKAHAVNTPSAPTSQT